jgi:hypothetical protein
MRIPVRGKALAAKLVAPGLACLALACGAFEESPAPPTPTPSGANLLADPGFEGLAPAWVIFPPAGAHEIAPGQAHGGDSSLALHLSPAVGALSASQAVNPAAFPEFLSGFYRVEGPSADDVLLQFVVKAGGGAPGEVREMRFVIAGAASDPEQATEARYVFLSRDNPAEDEWTYFAYPVAAAFQAHTGAIPQAWSSVDVSLGARALSGNDAATVYFDDVYLGTQAGNPNRPKETTN